MNDEQFIELKEEIHGLKMILALQAITGGTLYPGELIKYLHLSGLSKEEIKVLLTHRFGKRYSDKHMKEF